ncbi:MAG: ABC transporter substrate-binding protein [Aquamicrobium sp.]|uniref:ABC transporter substrate-binding protein n=1 Tax=Aquamicrobium sp. TaxID=1872579 RepID=UPI00349E898D|nr:ABC transporter substrate-binding protein [Aquamicrobium sp.]
MTHRINWLGRTGLAIVAAFGLLQGAQTPAMAQSAESVTFGFFAPLSGRFGANGERFKESVDLFVEQTNANGGIGGKPLVVLTEDDRGEPMQATAIAQKFSENPDVVAAIGSFTSGNSIAAGEIFATAGVPQVSPSSSHPDYTKISKFQFRIPNTQDTMSLMYVKTLKENAPHERVAVIYFQDDWGIYVGNATKAALEEGGSEVPVFEAMLPDARDFRPLVTKLRQANVDSILLASHYGPTAIFLQQLRQAGMEQQVVGPETLYNPELITLAGEAANGIITTTYFFPGDPTKAGFVEAYTAKYGREPDLWAAYAYDAISIAAAGAKALAEAGQPVTREALRDAIDDLPPFEGVTGVTEFVDGTPSKELTILKITDGAYTLLQ